MYQKISSGFVYAVPDTSQLRRKSGDSSDKQVGLCHIQANLLGGSTYTRYIVWLFKVYTYDITIAIGRFFRLFGIEITLCDIKAYKNTTINSINVSGLHLIIKFTNTSIVLSIVIFIVLLML